MMPLEKRPFKGRIFYFDLRFHRNQDELVKNIKKLGGKVESFICKEVTHAVTDRYYSKTKAESSTSKSLISTSSPIFDSGYYGSPVALTPSPTNDILKPTSILSRGQALLQQAKSKNEGSTDLLRTCKLLNIKLVHLQKVLNVISQYKEQQILKKAERENKVNHKISKGKKLKKFQEEIKEPFIKIEDCNRIYRTVYKTFSPGYNCFHPKFLRVFNAMRKKGTSNSLSVLKPSQCDNTPYTSKSNINNKCTKFLSPFEASHIAKKNTKDSKKKKNSKPKSKFCEICDCSYESLNEHLVTLKHKQFLSDRKNFLVVDKVLSTLPNIDEFLKKSQLSEAEAKDNISSEIFADDVLIIDASFESEIFDPYPELKEHNLLRSSSEDCLEKNVDDIVFCEEMFVPSPAPNNVALDSNCQPSMYCKMSPLKSNVNFSTSQESFISNYPFRNFGFGSPSILDSPDAKFSQEICFDMQDEQCMPKLGEFKLADSLNFSLPNEDFSLPVFSDDNIDINDDEFKALVPIDLSICKKDENYF